MSSTGVPASDGKEEADLETNQVLTLYYVNFVVFFKNPHFFYGVLGRGELYVYVAEMIFYILKNLTET